MAHLEDIGKSGGGVDSAEGARGINGNLSSKCFYKWLRPNPIGGSAAGRRRSVEIPTRPPPSGAAGGGGRHGTTARNGRGGGERRTKKRCG